MRTDFRRTVWALVVLLSISTLVSAERRARLIGKVVDPKGEPIAGVTVKVTSPDDSDFQALETTDKKGIFKVDFERVGIVYRYALEKAGFVSVELEWKWNAEGTEHREFKMQAGEVAAVAGAPPATTSSSAVRAFNEGVKAFEAKDYATATAKFEEALDNDPALRQAWEAMSLAQLEQKHYPQAVEAAEKARALGSTDLTVLRTRWEAYRKLGDAAKTQEARADLEKVGRLNEEAKRVHNEGVALEKSGDEVGALAKFQEALEMDPNLQPALLALGAATLKTKHPGEAAAAAKKILAVDPQNKEGLGIQYNAALQLGDVSRIVDALVALAAVDPATAKDGLFKLGVKAFDSDDAKNAKDRFSKVLALDPNDARSHYYLGVMLVREGAKAEAKTHLQRFLALAPGDPDAATAKGLLDFLSK